MKIPFNDLLKTDTVITSLALHKVVLSAGAYVQNQGDDNHDDHLVGNDNVPGKQGIRAFTGTITAMKVGVTISIFQSSKQWRRILKQTRLTLKSQRQHFFH